MSNLPDDDDVELGSILSSHVAGPSHALLTDSTESQTIPAHKLYRLYQWLQGPQPPRSFRIEPILARIQNESLASFQRKCPTRKQRSLLYTFLCSCWIGCFWVILSTSLRGCHVPGHRSPIRLACISRPWRGTVDCGLNGSACRPFHDITFGFRCPADCRDVKIYSPETIGDIEYNYRSIVVGGSAASDDESSPVYRGDSFICAAAIHAGITNNYRGGSGVVSLIGERNNFQASEANGILSLNFTPTFPLSFTFSKESGGNTLLCRDPRWILLFITVTFTVTISMLTTTPSVFFGIIFVSVYFCVALASDPPDFESFLDVISSAFRGFLPAVFVGLVIYHFCILRTLNRLTAQVEKTFLWVGGCWLGALNNFTFDKLPIQRLTPHDLRQPGAVLTLAIIVLTISAIAISQAWAFRIEGRLLKYLAFYACIGLFLITTMSIPNMNIRIHHFVLALLLLPGTALQTRPSLFYQGLLVGLLISGIARWGFDSILQTSTDLFGDDFGSPIPKVDVPTISSSDHSITFSLTNIIQGYNSMSILVNDVERFRGSEDQDSDTFTWTRYKPGEPEYFRFAYVKYGIARESSVGRFTNPGIWEVDGTWIPPAPKSVD